MSDTLTFAAESERIRLKSPRTWKILVVDDDKEVHAVTRLMLENFVFRGAAAALLHAHSAAEGKDLLTLHPDTALILLDVVMETEHAGLDFVRHIRTEMNNHAVRIALRTGQPGQTPAQQVVALYDIDDYLPKSELRYQRLHILCTTALRAYALLCELEAKQIELQRLNEELARYAYTDSLTGLMNRRRFDAALEGEWKRTLRLRLPIAALMLDVDCFKAYNDNYGHPAGDRVLQQLARVLSEQIIKPGHSVCRFGGEEFAVLLPGICRAEGLRLGEDLRRRIEALALPHEKSPHGRVTISVGCASQQPASESDGTCAQGLIEAADRALYLAKNSGRNRVEPTADR